MLIDCILRMILASSTAMIKSGALLPKIFFLPIWFSTFAVNLFNLANWNPFFPRPVLLFVWKGWNRHTSHHENLIVLNLFI
jgi:hypothetical protein